MLKHILYLTYDGITDPLGQSQILPYLRGLADLGHRITVISFEKGDAHISHSLGSLDLQDNIKVIPLKYHKTPLILSTLFDIYLLKREVKKIIKSNQINIVHCRSYITSLVGLWVKRKHNVKFIFDMRGFWADERVEGKLWNRTNPVFDWIYKYFKRKELEFLANSDAVISLTNNAKDEMLNWKEAELNEKKVQVIPTCANFELFDADTVGEAEVAEIRADLGISKDDFVLLYLGSLGTWYMLDEILQFFSVLKAAKSKQHINTKFLFVTKDLELIQKALASSGLSDKDIIITQSDRENVPKYISLCDAGIFFIMPTFSKKASAATKMGEIMAMGKPVITNTGWGDVDTILENSGDGVLVPSLDISGYQHAVNEMDKMNFDPAEIRDHAEWHFSLAKGIEIYNEIYHQLAKKTDN